MPDTSTTHDPRRTWLHHMSRIGRDHGFYHRIGTRHAALFVQEGETLVLNFDRADRLWRDAEPGMPLGFDLVRTREWSMLSLMSLGRTWFRAAEVEAFLAYLASSGFFEGFERVVILASGADCGHAAARAAALVPGARVLLAQPAAGMSATLAPFDRRFRTDRLRLDADTPPPAPADALAHADHATILYDPKMPAEAAQAAMLDGPRITKIGLPHCRNALLRALRNPHVLVPLLTRIEAGPVPPAEVRGLLRPVLRRDEAYLARLRAARRR